MIARSFPRILEKKLQAILECGLRLTNTSLGQVLLIQKDYLVIRASVPRSFKRRLKSRLLSISDSVAGQAITKEESMLIPVHSDTKYKAFLESQRRYELAVPILTREKNIIGVVCFESLDNISEIDRRLLESLAYITSSVLQEYESVTTV